LALYFHLLLLRHLQSAPLPPTDLLPYAHGLRFPEPKIL